MKLLEPYQLGDLELKNRVVMAPMTRSRASSDDVPGALAELYYGQRSSMGLIISEGINISKQAVGLPFTPGLFKDDQVDAWRKIIDVVHDAGGHIFAQLWHTGRVGHSLSRDGEIPVAPSAIRIEGQKPFTKNGLQEYEIPRALETDEVSSIVFNHGIAAENAKRAGFDGVELHGAFGYLPNQFLVDGANKRKTVMAVVSPTDAVLHSK